MPKYQFDGVSKFSAVMIFTSLASSPFAFLTTGILGKFTFFILEKISNWLANKGLILLNVGVNYIAVLNQQGDYDKTIEEAIKKVKDNPGRLTDAQKKAIDQPVIDSFKRFVSLIN